MNGPTASVASHEVHGYLPNDAPPSGRLLGLAFQHVLTMFPATVLVAVLTHFDVGVTLFGSGVATILALLLSSRGGLTRSLPRHRRKRSTWTFN
jgi:xanthine/uracil permease